MLGRWNRWLIACLAPLALPGSAWAINIDGFYSTTEGYSQLFALSYRMADGTVLTGGTLAWGSDASGQYLYFSAPLGFVDNSYGANAIGWGAKGHTFDDLLKSDHAHMNFFTLSGTADAYIDYIAYNNTTGLYGSCGTTPAANSPYKNQCDSAGSDLLSQQIITDVASSLQYNINNFSGGPIDPLVDSPYADPNYQNIQVGYEGWQYKLAYEVAFAPGTFDPTIWGTSDANNVNLMLQFLDPHASPNKLNATTPPDVCIGPNCGPPDICIGVSCVPTSVPAPGALALMLGGFGALALGRRRRRV